MGPWSCVSIWRSLLLWCYLHKIAPPSSKIFRSPFVQWKCSHIVRLYWCIKHRKCLYLSSSWVHMDLNARVVLIQDPYGLEFMFYTVNQIQVGSRSNAGGPESVKHYVWHLSGPDNGHDQTVLPVIIILFGYPAPVVDVFVCIATANRLQSASLSQGGTTWPAPASAPTQDMHLGSESRGQTHSSTKDNTTQSVMLTLAEKGSEWADKKRNSQSYYARCNNSKTLHKSRSSSEENLFLLLFMYRSYLGFLILNLNVFLWHDHPL